MLLDSIASFDQNSTMASTNKVIANLMESSRLSSSPNATLHSESINVQQVKNEERMSDCIRQMVIKNKNNPKTKDKIEEVEAGPS